MNIDKKKEADGINLSCKVLFLFLARTLFWGRWYDFLLSMTLTAEVLRGQTLRCHEPDGCVKFRVLTEKDGLLASFGGVVVLSEPLRELEDLINVGSVTQGFPPPCPMIKLRLFRQELHAQSTVISLRLS